MKTEITVQCFNNLSDIFKILEQQGFVLIEKYQLNDWYFSHLTNEELKKLDFILKINNSFLVREIKEVDKITINLVYKAKIIDEQGNVVGEEKTRTDVSNLNKALEIFKKTGLNNWCEIKNTSYVFAKDNKEIALQDIENLGIFIEFEEYEDIKNLSPNEKFKLMKKDIQKLNLSLGNDFSVKKAELMFKKIH